jgi:4'-phosphopantetheinyl transferase EntD
VIAPLFLLYDYTFWPPGARSAAEGLALAYDSGVMCTDELVLHPDPHESRRAWCEARVSLTEQRLAVLDPGTPVVLVNHYPLVREPLRVLRLPEFALWCGTVRTADWHRRFNAVAVVYGHLHIRRTTWHDGVPFMEVSVGYPREWAKRGAPGWPDGVVGSITHCERYRAAAVASTSDLVTIGIDAEPNQPLPAGVLEMVALPPERAMLAALAESVPGVAWDRLLFSAKESVYKAWAPLTGTFLDFDGAEVAFDAAAATFVARLSKPGASLVGDSRGELAGRFAVCGGLVVTAIARAPH